MIYVNDKPLLANEAEILLRVRQELALDGYDYFSIIRPSGHNTMTNCPFHKGGQEKMPSFGISKDGICHCFTCGWVGTIDEMISELLQNRTDGGKYGRSWLIRHFVALSVSQRQKIVIRDSRAKENSIKNIPTFTEDELKKYRYYHPYMYERKLDDRIIEMFDVGYDANFRLRPELPITECITFPVYDENNNPVFIARRAIKSKLFHYPPESDKPVYAANIVNRDKIGCVVIAESILNALTCWKHKIPAVALLGIGTEHQYKILSKLPVRKYVLALDNDAAGNAGREKLKKALCKNKIITEWDIPKGKDLNDLDEEILNLKEFF